MRMSMSTSFLSDMALVWIPKISCLPFLLGFGTSMSRSSLPGLRIAGSRISFRLVAPMILTLSQDLQPSISASSCMNVLFASLSPDVPTSSLVAAKLSSSSMNTMLSALLRASSKISFTSFAPSPMNFCTSSEPTTSMNVLSVEAATAFASKVFPVPLRLFQRQLDDFADLVLLLLQPANHLPRNFWLLHDDKFLDIEPFRSIDFLQDIQILLVAQHAVPGGELQLCVGRDKELVAVGDPDHSPLPEHLVHLANH